MQYMSREIVRASRKDPSRLLTKDTSYLTIREAEIWFDQNGRTAAVATQICGDEISSPFSANALRGTYQVCETTDSQIGERIDSATPDQVHDFLAGIADMDLRMKWPREKRINYQITNLPGILYDPALHGCFLFSDEHNFDPALVANRVMVGMEKWRHLMFDNQHLNRKSKVDGAVIAINQWCSEHCSGSYAWTCAGPIWVFTEPNDAFLFRIMWG
jgi:hypothetical protein